MHRYSGRIGAVALAGLLAVITGCGNDDDDGPTTTAPPEETTAGDEGAEGEGETITVTGVDYGYEDLPDSIDAGTTIEFVNASDVEAHELVAIRIPDDETRSVEDLMALPEDELFGIFGEAGPPEPALVSIAGPGQDGMAVVGDGTISEPGRYAVACFFPVGGDPAEILDPDAEGPPERGDAPPHTAEGMFAELTVS